MVVITIDNMDECTSDSIVLDVFATLSDLVAKTASVLICPVHPDTFSLIQPVISDRRPLDTIEIASPPFKDVLKKRLEFAFSTDKDWMGVHRARMTREWPQNLLGARVTFCEFVSSVRVGYQGFYSFRCTKDRCELVCGDWGMKTALLI